MSTEQKQDQIKILVVDDQPGVRLTLKGILSKKGYDVAVAEDGTQALAMARKTPFRVVFMDIKMPGLNGVDTYIQMKEINPQSTVVMMTAFALEDDIKRAIQEGAYAVIYKPFDINNLLGILQECLEQRHLILVVDDHVEDRTLLKKILEEKGYRVVLANNGEECLHQIKEKRFQIILLDVKMQGMDGITTLKQVKQIRPDVGVIMITGYSIDELLEDALRHGSFSCLRKPFDIDHLLNTMDQCLKKAGQEKA